MLFGSCRYLLVGGQEPTHRRLRRHLGVRAEDRVLDVCCGVGEFAGDIPAEYVGIDLNHRFVAAASRRYIGAPAKTFRVMDALAMDLEDKSFSKAIFINGLHHFSDQKGRRLLEEIRRVTRERVVVVDADGTRRGLLRRALLAADRGDWMRTPEALTELIGSTLRIRTTERFNVGLYTELLFDCGVDGP
jgi:ubiquinone/menaquinone biosynthesis C-methylase UbiE